MVALLISFTIALAAEKPRPVAPPKCYSEQDVKDEGCRTLCIRDGYTGGKAYKKGCSCFDVKDSLEDFALRRVTLGARMHSLPDRDTKPVARAPWYSSEPDESEQ